MWTHATSVPPASWNSVRRRAQTRRQPTTWVDPTSSSAVRRSGADDPSSAARTSQTRPRSRVPGPVEPADGRVVASEVLGVAEEHRRPDPAVRSGLVEADPVGRCAAVRARGRSRGAARRGRRASRGRRARCPSVGAVWRSRRTAHDRSASKTTSADRQPLLLVGGVGPRVVELVQDVRVDAARAPLAVVRLGRAGSLHGDVVRVDLRGDAIEQDPPLAPDGLRARRAGPAAGGELLDDRAADLAADLLAAVGDLERGGQDRFAPLARRRRRLAGPKSVGNVARQPSASVVSPFMTARASTRWATVASASSVATRATSGSAWIPAYTTARASRAASWNLTSAAPERDAGRPAGTSRASRWRGAGPSIRPISSIARSIGRRDGRRDRLGRRARRRRPQVRRARRPRGR